MYTNSNHRFIPAALATAQARRPTQGFLGDFLDDLKNFGSKVFSGAKDIAKTEGKAEAYQEIAKGQAAAPSASGIPSWVMPVAIGAGVLGIVLILKKRR